MPDIDSGSEDEESYNMSSAAMKVAADG